MLLTPQRIPFQALDQAITQEQLNQDLTLAVCDQDLPFLVLVTLFKREAQMLMESSMDSQGSYVIRSKLAHSCCSLTLAVVVKPVSDCASTVQAHLPPLFHPSDHCLVAAYCGCLEQDH